MGTFADDNKRQVGLANHGGQDSNTKGYGPPVNKQAGEKGEEQQALGRSTKEEEDQGDLQAKGGQLSLAAAAREEADAALWKCKHRSYIALVIS